VSSWRRSYRSTVTRTGLHTVVLEQYNKLPWQLSTRTGQQQQQHVSPCPSGEIVERTHGRWRHLVGGALIKSHARQQWRTAKYSRNAALPAATLPGKRENGAFKICNR